MTTHRHQSAAGSDAPPMRKGLWERLFEAWWIPLFILPMAAGVIADVVGIDLAVTFGAIPTLVIMLVLSWARNKQRRKRLMSVAVRERSFECWLRHPHARRDSLGHRWAYGTASVKTGTLTFQPLGGPDGQPMGRAAIFTDLVRLGRPEVPASERRGAHRSWPAVALQTDRGVIELLCPPEAEVVLSELGS